MRGDRHHRRALETPTEVRNALLYVLQNHRRHGVRVSTGTFDPYSTAVRFRHWAHEAGAHATLHGAGAHATLHETEPWPAPSPRTWLLGTGWLRAGGPLRPSELPRAARESGR